MAELAVLHTSLIGANLALTLPAAASVAAVCFLMHIFSLLVFLILGLPNCHEDLHLLCI